MACRHWYIYLAVWAENKIRFGICCGQYLVLIVRESHHLVDDIVVASAGISSVSHRVNENDAREFMVASEELIRSLKRVPGVVVKAFEESFVRFIAEIVGVAFLDLWVDELPVSTEVLRRVATKEGTREVAEGVHEVHGSEFLRECKDLGRSNNTAEFVLQSSHRSELEAYAPCKKTLNVSVKAAPAAGSHCQFIEYIGTASAHLVGGGTLGLLINKAVRRESGKTSK